MGGGASRHEARSAVYRRGSAAGRYQSDPWHSDLTAARMRPFLYSFQPGPDTTLPNPCGLSLSTAPGLVHQLHAPEWCRVGGCPGVVTRALSAMGGTLAPFGRSELPPVPSESEASPTADEALFEALGQVRGFAVEGSDLGAHPGHGADVSAGVYLAKRVDQVLAGENPVVPRAFGADDPHPVI